MRRFAGSVRGRGERIEQTVPKHVVVVAPGHRLDDEAREDVIRVGIVVALSGRKEGLGAEHEPDELFRIKGSIQALGLHSFPYGPLKGPAADVVDEPAPVAEEHPQGDGVAVRQAVEPGTVAEPAGDGRIQVEPVLLRE